MHSLPFCNFQDFALFYKHAPLKQRKIHRCTICNYSTPKTTNLNTHMMMHTGQKPFKCIHCPKSFTTKSNLKQHYLVHLRMK
ncbi:hypothetical protein CDAR_121781 [Caerostris darwini]|uniref:C2H2-type domain-containing protein n=1 Tax=Caerostris darwini TaxID=1538125 RepID=A0AAV4UFT2_9ARAC|nr:hypothetical protein CDAR_121781 [Caerostris darwini]